MSTLLLIPTHRCNLRCRYCYEPSCLKEEEGEYTPQLVERIIDQYYAYVTSSTDTKPKIIWHGGEVLLWGIRNFEHALAYCERVFGEKKVKHSLQTNLTLITPEYIELFKKYKVGVGFSIDGPPEFNDKTRVFANGKGTSTVLEEKIRLCREYKLNLGAIVVATRYNIGSMSQIYEYLNGLGIVFKVNPLFECGEAKNSFNELAVSPALYAEAMIGLFDYWTKDPNARVNISTFTDIAGSLGSNKTTLCCYTRNCQQNFTCIAPNGNIFPCARFAGGGNFIYGNIQTEDLTKVITAKREFFFQKRVVKIENEKCKGCRFISICYGGCMHDAWVATGHIDSKSLFCESYRKIFMHIEEYLKSNQLRIRISTL